MTETTQDETTPERALAPEAHAEVQRLANLLGVDGLATVRRFLDVAASDRNTPDAVRVDMRVGVELIEAIGVGFIIGTPEAARAAR